MSEQLMRYGEMREWLASHGLSEWEVRELIRTGQIKKGYLRKPTSRRKACAVKALYSRKQIERDVLAQIQFL